ncbi:MAG: hypothetical protein WA755_05780 [Candidatus Acidiferrales bacterium]
MQAHIEHLSLHFPEHRKKFVKLLGADPEAAQAEAVVFALLKILRRNPEPADDPETGGVDFLCKPNGRAPFVVEVTKLGQDTISRHSHIPKEQLEGGGAFEMVTSAVLEKVRRKTPQLADYPYARVLVVASSHHAAVTLFDAMCAEWLLTSEPNIRYVPGAPQESFRETVDLKKAIFFRLNEADEIVPCRQSISAVLLISFDDVKSQVLGILHPQSAHAFDIGNLEDVSFIRVSEWPIVRDELKTEWVVANPEAKGFYHIAVKPLP